MWAIRSPSMGRFQDKVVVITGAGRGQGRTHALAFAAEGAAVAVCDIAAPVASCPYPLATPDDLSTTADLVSRSGARCHSAVVDVRDADAIGAFVADVGSALGPIDVCVANAGICGFAKSWELTDEQWEEMLAIDLGGVFKTFRAVLPSMIERRKGRLVATSSMAGRAGNPNLSHYAAAKWGVIGFVKSVALEVATFGITANVVCPSTVDTPMVHNPAMYSLFAPHLERPGIDEVRPVYERMNPMHLDWLDPAEVSAAVLYLASDDARHVSGVTWEIAAGTSALKA